MLDESKFSLIDGKKLFCMNLNIATLLSVCVERPTLFRATSLQAVRSILIFKHISVFFKEEGSQRHDSGPSDERMNVL